MEDKNTLASEVLEMLKGQLKFYKILVAQLVFLLAATNIFHIWQWSQFDTIAVESGDGAVPADKTQLRTGDRVRHPNPHEIFHLCFHERHGRFVPNARTAALRAEQ